MGFCRFPGLKRGAWGTRFGAISVAADKGNPSIDPTTALAIMRDPNTELICENLLNSRLVHAEFRSDF
jgi:hypothetical protein